MSDERLDKETERLIGRFRSTTRDWAVIWHEAKVSADPSLDIQIEAENALRQRIRTLIALNVKAALNEAYGDGADVVGFIG